MVEKEFVLNHGGFHLHLDDIRALISVLMVALVVAARSASRIKGKPDSNLARLPVTIYRRTDGGRVLRLHCSTGCKFPESTQWSKYPINRSQKVSNCKKTFCQVKPNVFERFELRYKIPDNRNSNIPVLIDPDFRYIFLTWCEK